MSINMYVLLMQVKILEKQRNREFIWTDEPQPLSLIPKPWGKEDNVLRVFGQNRVFRAIGTIVQFEAIQIFPITTKFFKKL